MKGMNYILLMVIMFTAFCHDPCCAQAQKSNKCLDDFLAVLTHCSKEAGLSGGNIIWFTSNGSYPKSEIPANQEGFKNQACKSGVEAQLTTCTSERMPPVIKSAACKGFGNSNQQTDISARLSSLMRTYKTKCSNIREACRSKLITDLRGCFTSQGLSAQYLLFNFTDGNMIGKTEEDVNKFCGLKEAVVRCMQNVSDLCLNTTDIFRSIGLDIKSYLKGVSDLCNNSDVYLSGLGCFHDAVPKIDQCKMKESQSLTQLGNQSLVEKWPNERITSEHCRIARTQLECTSSALTPSLHENCTDDVITLRRRVECERMPTYCQMDIRSKICQASFRNATDEFSSGSPEALESLESSAVKVSIGIASAVMLLICLLVM